MRSIARSVAAASAGAWLALVGASAALAQAPSGSGGPTDSPSAWNRVWPWLLLGGGLFVLLLLGAVGFSWQRRRAPQAAAPAAGAPVQAADREAEGPRDIAVLTFAAINGAEQAFAAVREHAANEPWVRDVAFAEHHRRGRLVVRGTFAGRYLDLDEHIDAIDLAKPAGALLDELRADVPEGSSALVVFASTDEVDEMIAALHGAGGEVTRHHVGGEAAAALEASVAQAPPAAPPPAAV
jgi:hypothetical protein